MGVVIIIMVVVAGVSLYDYFAARSWQQVTSTTRNEIVFADRNQEYGAFALRRDYDKIMMWVIVGVVGVVGVTYASYKIIQSIPVEEVPPPKIDTSNLALPAPPEEETPPPPKEELPPPMERTIAFPPPIFVDIEVDEEVVIQEKLEDTKADTKTNETEEDTWGKPEQTVVKEEVVEKKEEPILEFIEEDAEFPGGTAALQQWIVKNVQYPQTSIEMSEEGKVYVSFVVEPDGSISNVQVERGVSDDLDKEAKRLTRSMPRWKPGKNNGKAVRARCRLPINFTLG